MEMLFAESDDADEKKERKTEKRPAMERPTAPLYDNGRFGLDVLSFWARQPWDLKLDQTGMAGNCTFCFQKGYRKLVKITRHLKAAGDMNEYKNTPADIDWWIRMETFYERDADKEGWEMRTHKGRNSNNFGFFGVKDDMSYRTIKELAAKAEAQGEAFELDAIDEVFCKSCTD